MLYSISQLASLAGISARTLRYYDQIGLLPPDQLSLKGYRQYGESSVNRLQQICFFKTFGLPLKEIMRLMQLPDSERQQQLAGQRDILINQRKQLEQLIKTLDVALQINQQGGTIMTDAAKFAAFKQNKIAANQQNYGDEIEKVWGKATVDTANQQFSNLSQTQYAQATALEQNLINDLIDVIDAADLNSEQAKAVVNQHREWLQFFWSTYTPEAHRQLGKMYISDSRFGKYYQEKTQRTNAAKVLDELIQKYA